MNSIEKEDKETVFKIYDELLKSRMGTIKTHEITKEICEIYNVSYDEIIAEYAEWNVKWS